MVDFETHISQLDNSSKFINDKFECYLIDEKTIYIHYFRNAVIELDDTLLGLEIGKGLSPGDDTKMIVKMDNFAEITRASREYLQNNMRTLSAEAHVIPSLAYKIVFNIFIKLRKKKHPLKAFDTLDAALIWIKNI